ncbi:hypothetical protein AKJ09_01539 [Labilithrix luteola]|uniref:Uncharacterized protein n=1 Tax=Labilithrix luteola TaxID=1391654 RepID=A0A0K1PMW0_9BACT|nr:hypothetical protein AKJ09_01539 [Labilithrix luteola]
MPPASRVRGVCSPFGLTVEISPDAMKVSTAIGQDLVEERCERRARSTKKENNRTWNSPAWPVWVH